MKSLYKIGVIKRSLIICIMFHIADKFPAKEWAEVKKIKDISFSNLEKSIIILSILLLFTAAYIEAFLLVM